MTLKETIAVFKKKGGSSLLKQYLKGGAFFTAASEFVLLGKDRTALEILRLAAGFKIKKKLSKKYSRYISEFEQKYDASLEHKSSDKVWICWLQGIDKAPLLVQKCYEEAKKMLPRKDIVLITEDNYKDYVTFPDHIIDKWKRGVITHTHFTDLLRLELLIRYGGLWLDATVLCTEKEENIPEYFFDSELFFFQTLKPGRDGHCTYMSSWLMSARTNNKVLCLTRDLCYKYWETNDKMVDYFLLHEFMSIVLDRFPKEWNAIVPRDNSTPHILLLRFFDQYDEKLWGYIKEQSPFHKLSYKFTEDEIKKKGTFYDVLFGDR